MIAYMCPKFLLIGFLLLFTFAHKSNAQDTLILKDGSEIYVKVLEIGDKSISYKKANFDDGSIYKVDQEKVFIAIYKNGRRESFQSEGTHTGINIDNKVPTLKNNSFEVRLIESKNIPDNKKQSIFIIAEIQVFRFGNLFTKLSLSAYQQNDIELNYTNIKNKYLLNSYVSILSSSETITELLYQKFEKSTGKGYGWALPPNFFSLDPKACSVAFVEQKVVNSELVGFGGFSSTKMTLQDCTSLESKLLSLALLWLEVNFIKH